MLHQTAEREAKRVEIETAIQPMILFHFIEPSKLAFFSDI
jgi:hypothetical protein